MSCVLEVLRANLSSAIVHRWLLSFSHCLPISFCYVYVYNRSGPLYRITDITHGKCFKLLGKSYHFA